LNYTFSEITAAEVHFFLKPALPFLCIIWDTMTPVLFRVQVAKTLFVALGPCDRHPYKRYGRPDRWTDGTLVTQAHYTYSACRAKKIKYSIFDRMLRESCWC